MPRFVILHHVWPQHDTRAAHYDLMLEYEGTLRTWAIAAPLAPGCSLSAEQLPDHRLAYLDYEGPVSNDRGHVTRWASGEYEVVQLTENHWELQLHSAAGEWRVVLVREAETPLKWMLTCS